MFWIVITILLWFVCCKFFYEGGRTMMRKEIIEEMKNYTFIKKINTRI